MVSMSSSSKARRRGRRQKLSFSALARSDKRHKREPRRPLLAHPGPTKPSFSDPHIQRVFLSWLSTACLEMELLEQLHS
ncbi:hypothetical protein VTN02DRAFT_5333 [Thermoascus thermophilus]